MPFYRFLLVTRNDLAVASLYNKFVETAKYVMNNGGVFQRIYNTGEHRFRYCFLAFYVMIVDIQCFARQTLKHIHRDLCSLFNFAVLLKLWKRFTTISKVLPMYYFDYLTIV